ncbi:MAG: hypothetical protein PHV74_09180 [Dehalococcoidia bacterium]|nr:hypothetical protein [Dehalococcoidia bacterium]
MEVFGTKSGHDPNTPDEQNQSFAVGAGEGLLFSAQAPTVMQDISRSNTRNRISPP